MFEFNFAAIAASTKIITQSAFTLKILICNNTVPFIMRIASIVLIK